jgi:hypothetical protein
MVRLVVHAYGHDANEAQSTKFGGITGRSQRHSIE